MVSDAALFSSLVFEGLSRRDPAAEKKAVDAVNEFTRLMMFYDVTTHLKLDDPFWKIRSIRRNRESVQRRRAARRLSRFEHGWHAWYPRYLAWYAREHPDLPTQQEIERTAYAAMGRLLAQIRMLDKE